MSTAKKKALDVISALPDDTPAQEIIEQLYRIYQIKRGLAARQEKADPLWGALRGSVVVDAALDLTAPVLQDPLDAAAGRLHR
jgi:hypothetical protein